MAASDTHFINTILFINILLCKNMHPGGLEFFTKVKKSKHRSKNKKRVKNVIMK